MSCVYLDLHIHTSEDPNNLNTNYNLESLIKNVKKMASSAEAMISFTDHNTINKKIYLEALDKGLSLMLGVELHISYDLREEPYHCHMYFNVNIDGGVIDEINRILDTLYLDKVVIFGTSTIPKLDEIVIAFDEYDYLLLPHGGQSHRTFDSAIPTGARFDNAIERSIYHNHFDGFTARSNQGLEKTQEYFRRLGIKDFVNLITCSDNYTPEKYPEAKSSEASAFIPTWMLAQPNFSGLRLSLSESSRLSYGTKPQEFSEHIQQVTLHNDLIDIDVKLSPGLNVVIGGSSSGKTLFVDSIFNKIVGDFKKSEYLIYGVENISVDNPSGVHPYYINQNYIIEVIGQANDKAIDDIEIIKRIFPGDKELIGHVNASLAKLKKDIDGLIATVQRFEAAKGELSRIPILSSLVLKKKKSGNIFLPFLPSRIELERIKYTETLYNQHVEHLEDIEQFIQENPFLEVDNELFEKLKQQLLTALKASNLAMSVNNIMLKKKQDYGALLTTEDMEQQTKAEGREKLIDVVERYVAALADFENMLNRIMSYEFFCKTDEVSYMGHTLYIENNFKINQDMLLAVFNKYLKSDCKIIDITQVTPHDFLEEKYSKKSPKVLGYDSFAAKIYGEFEGMNNRKYKIRTADGRDFNTLSAGWKTSVLLDLILGYEQDIAPIIIDQPEDNLATHYINHGLVEAIKKIKNKKQIILVSHNATIPMLGDAQTVVVCMNESANKMNISSCPLEGTLRGKAIVDHIAEITDGGKPSIKKRIKKYNLKSFKE